jgi:hypothetical protein
MIFVEGDGHVWIGYRWQQRRQRYVFGEDRNGNETDGEES